MGRTHAISGAVVWLTGCGVLTAAGVHPDGPGVVIGATVAAGAALLPDLDHPCSTVARTAGPVSRALCTLLARGCARVHAATKTRLDRADLDGHRTLTHTVLFAAVVGFFAGLLCWLGGWGVALVVGGLAALGVRGSVHRRRFRGLAVPAGFLAAAVVWQAGAAPWAIGAATAVGCLAHCVGDAATNSGCPMLWPLQVRGRRWYLVGTPRRLRFGTGGLAESAVLVVLVLAGLGEVGWLVAM